VSVSIITFKVKTYTYPILYYADDGFFPDER